MQAEVTALEPSLRQVTVRTEDGSQQIGYDYLMYALGSFVRTDAVPGTDGHAYTLDHTSAGALAERLPGVAARGGRLLVVGGGITGVEVATELAETYPGLDITLVTRRSFASQLSPAARVHIRKAFDRFGIHFMENTGVLHLEEHGALTDRGGTIPFDVCVWVGGFAVSDLARRAGVPVNVRGQILIDRAMRSISNPEIYAVGDAASPADEPGAPVRMSVYTALAMGAHGAECLAAELAGKSPTAFGLSYAALGLSLGRRDGVVQFLDGNRDTPLRLTVPGKLANLTRELFVHLAVAVIKAQRTVPWVFYWPGKNKMQRVPVHQVPRPAAPVPAGAEPAARAGR